MPPKAKEARLMKRVLIAALVLSTGCVTQGTFDALKQQDDQAQKDLAERNAKVDAQEQVIASQKAQLESSNAKTKDLEAALAEEQAKNATLATQIAGLQGDLAKLVKDRSSLKGSVDDMRVALAELQQRKSQAEARIAEYKSLLGKFQSLIDAGKLKVKMTDGRMVVVLATDVLFASGSANLSKGGKAAIAEVAGLLASIPKRSFQVEGHTDNVPISTAQYPSNWELAAARSLTVVKTMVDAGLPAQRVSAASYGDTRPAVANDTTEGRAQNRRIEITVVPDLSTLPGFEELQKVTQTSTKM
jgi:chemotaxis protein MotB